MIFKPEDFSPLIGMLVGEAPKETARIANEIINKLIETSPMVYSTNKGAVKDVWSDNEKPYDTHRARLMFIEEINRVPCQHEPIKSAMTGLIRNICAHCGVKIKATWSEVK